MAYTAPLTYKGRPLVRCKNELYYGSSNTLCLSVHAALFYKGNYAWCSKRLRNVILC